MLLVMVWLLTEIRDKKYLKLVRNKTSHAPSKLTWAKTTNFFDFTMHDKEGWPSCCQDYIKNWQYNRGANNPCSTNTTSRVGGRQEYFLVVLKAMEGVLIGSLKFKFSYFTIKNNRQNNTSFILWEAVILSFQGGYIKSKSIKTSSITALSNGFRFYYKRHLLNFVSFEMCVGASRPLHLICKKIGILYEPTRCTKFLWLDFIFH